MEIRDLTPLGYPGYSIREDGWLITPKGRLVGGNANGQVRLPASGGGTEWRSLRWLVAKAFVPNPYGFVHVAVKDGNKDNIHYTNLEWVPMQRNAGRKRAAILQLLRQGKKPKEVAREVNTSVAYVRTVAAERYRELQIIAQLDPQLKMEP